MQSRLSDLEEKVVTFPAHSRVVIIGGGPAGLSAALLFEKKGFAVTVVEKRDAYTRSTHYVDLVFRQLNDMLRAFHIPLTIQPSYANHIKDVEKSLAEFIANESDIVVIHGEYHTHSTAGVHIKYPNKTEGVLPYDILVDCTGYHALVIHEINKLHGTPVFTRQTVAESPHPNYIQAGVLVFTEKTEKVRIVFPEEGELPEEEFEMNQMAKMPHYSSEAASKAMADLHAMGWKYAAAPAILSFLQVGNNPKKETKDDPGVKHRFYSEVPAELKKEQVIPWIHACFKANYGVEEIPFRVELIHPSRKHPGKKQYDIYEFLPQYTTPYFYEDPENAKLYLHFGDSSFNHLFTEGAGLRRTISTLTSFFDKTKMNEAGEIEIQLTRYAKWCERDLPYHFEFIYKAFKERKEQLKLLASEEKELDIAIKNLGLMQQQIKEKNSKVNPNQFFQPASDFQVVIDELLKQIVMGDQNQARQILSVPMFSHLMFEPGTVTDLSENRLVGYTPFALACYSHDVEMLEMMMAFLPNIPNGYQKFLSGLEKTYEALLQQKPYDFKPLFYVLEHGDDTQKKNAFATFRASFQPREIKEEVSFNIENLINAYQICKEKFASLSDQDRLLFWRQAVGWSQRMLSAACYTQAICNGLYYIAHEKKPLVRNLNLSDETPFYDMTIEKDRGFGLNYAIHVTLRGARASRILSDKILEDLMDGYTFKNLRKLVELKKTGLIKLIEQVKKLENKQSLTGP